MTSLRRHSADSHLSEWGLIIKVESLLIEGCRYDEIGSLYAQQLGYTLVEDSTEATRTSVDKKINTFVQGDLEHAAEMVSALWKIVNEDTDITPPTNTVPAVSLLRIRPLLCAV